MVGAGTREKASAALNQRFSFVLSQLLEFAEPRRHRSYTSHLHAKY